MKNDLQVVQGPKEGKWFKVDPNAIDQRLFEEERKDIQQEETRQLILEAFAELKNNPEKYGRKFKTMMPKKDWQSKRDRELLQLARTLGNHNADWVEQALEWAQRICNGESWEAICNKPDKAKCLRFVIWKDGIGRLVGGSSHYQNTKQWDFPASYVDYSIYYPLDSIYSTVPLVVRYGK